MPKSEKCQRHEWGYRLVKLPDMYTVGEIIKCLEGDM